MANFVFCCLFSQIAVNHKSAQETAVADLVEQKQTLENKRLETLDMYRVSLEVKKQLVLKWFHIS